MNIRMELTPVWICHVPPVTIDDRPTAPISDSDLLEIIKQEYRKQQRAEAMQHLGSVRIDALAYALRESVQELVKLFDERGDKA